MTSSPFDSFSSFEAANGLPAGFIRRLNSTNPDTNAWSRLERSEVGLEEFAALFEAEAAALGRNLDARALLAGLAGEIRPAMVEAVRRCHERLKTGLLTNNFNTRGPKEETESSAGFTGVLHHFDVIVESSKSGFRKPDLRFYETACELLQIEPTEAVFLDDLGINLKPARAMGMKTIKVVDTHDALDQLEELVGFALR